MRSLLRAVSWLVALLLVASCAGGPRGRVASAVDRDDLEGALEAYDQFRGSEGGDADLLGRIASLLLEREARSDDGERRRAAVLQLSLAGTAGAPALERLAAEAGVGPARLAALGALARHGSESARLSLRALADSDDDEVVEASVLGMDATLDEELLLGLLDRPHAGLRAAAATALAPRASESEVRRALAQVARVDPEARVRAAAVRSLGRGGVAAVDPLRERLADPESMVRLAAVGALVTADQTQGLAAIAPLLAVSPSPAGIEAARLIAQLEGEDVATDAANARAFLRRALFADRPGLRSQAGVALTGLSADREAPRDAVVEALAQEQDPEVRLSFARALWRSHRPVARAALEALLEVEGMAKVQAAALLATLPHAAAREALQAVASSDATSVLRRTAVRALAREAMRPDAARGFLVDDDSLVRIYAAGGILAAAAAS